MWDLERFGEKEAVRDDGGNGLTYRELQWESERLYHSIGKRCLIMVLCTNTVGSLIGYVSCMENHVVPMLLGEQLERTLLDNLIALYHPAYLWLPDQMTGSFPNAKKVYAVHEYTLLRMDFEDDCTLYEELALLLTTSGSTGSPKFVRQSYRNVQSNAESIAKYLELDETERPITTLPMHYTYGLSIINSHLLMGATILMTEQSVMQRGFWMFFQEEGATSFGGVPYTYEMLEKMRFMGMKLPSLRTMTQAGGKLSPELHRKFAEFASDSGKRFIVMYGQCEATARMSYLPANEALDKVGSIGIAIPGGTLRLVDDRGCTIDASGQTGELVYEGDNVTLGYAECGMDLTKGDERNGRLHTGDLARKDEDGYFYIVGRKKRFLKIFGNRVNLDEIDGMLRDAFLGMELACAGTDDNMVVFVTEDGKEDAIRTFLTEKTGLNHSAFSVRQIDEIPKNDAGKILYGELEKL